MSQKSSEKGSPFSGSGHFYFEGEDTFKVSELFELWLGLIQDEHKIVVKSYNCQVFNNSAYPAKQVREESSSTDKKS